MNRRGPVGGIRRGPGPRGPPAPVKVDRERTCPFHVRVFLKTGGHHDDREFTAERVPVQDAYELYTWRDATAKEIVTMLKDVSPLLRTKGPAKFTLRHVYFDMTREIFMSRDWATVTNKDIVQDADQDDSSRHGRFDRTLNDSRFVIGDMIDVAYLPPVSQLPLDSARAQGLPGLRGGQAPQPVARRPSDNPWSRGRPLSPPRRNFNNPDDAGRGFRADAFDRDINRSRSRSPPPRRSRSPSPRPLRRDSTPL